MPRGIFGRPLLGPLRVAGGGIFEHPSAEPFCTLQVGYGPLSVVALLHVRGIFGHPPAGLLTCRGGIFGRPLDRCGPRLLAHLR